MRGNVGIAACLLLLLGLCLGLESRPDFTEARRSFQSPAVPAAMLDRGTFGEVLTELGLVSASKNDESLFPKTDGKESGLSESVFQKKRVVGDLLLEARPRRGANLASSTLMTKSDTSHGRPVLSVVVAEEDLHDKKTGIIARYGARGRKWERMAQVSYYDDAQLQFATVAGIRLHGGGTHREENESFRLYFRKSLGMPGMPSELIGENGRAPIRTLVVRKHWYRGHVFTPAIAHELAAKMGARVGDLKMAEFYLNGEYRGPYHLTEHVSPRQWVSHLDPPDRSAHYFYRYRSSSDDESVLAFAKLNAWSVQLPRDCNMEEVREWVDLEALVRHLFVFAFCGTTDWRQGMAVRPRQEGGTWSWVTWDLDHSFIDLHPEQSQERDAWEQPALVLIASGDRWDKDYERLGWRAQDARSRILRVLFGASSEFGLYFAGLTNDIMNHEIPPSYLEGLAERYTRLAQDMGRMDEMLEALPAFFEHRPDFIRQSFRQHLDLGQVVSLTVNGPTGASMMIDGYVETLPYTGHYYAGRDVTLAAVDPDAGAVCHVVGESRSRVDESFVIRADSELECLPAG